MVEKKKQFVNGPINLVRMEGKVGSVNKVLYTFFDYHLQTDLQTECEDIDAIEIKQYLLDSFYKMSENKDKSYDFFMETFATLIFFNPGYKDKYIDQLVNMFGKLFKFDFKSNKVQQTTKFSNIRFHYMDIRPYFEYDVTSGLLTNRIINYFSSIQGKILPNQLNTIKDSISILGSRVKYVYNQLYSKNKKGGGVSIVLEKLDDLSKYTNEFYQQRIDYLIDKIRYKYSNKDVKKKLNGFIDKELYDSFNKFFARYEKLDKYLEKVKNYLNIDFFAKIEDEDRYSYFGSVSWKYSRIIKCDLDEMLHELHTIYVSVFATVMDVYFLRRYLDKDYITNGISYTGAAHSENYIYVLSKYFGFKSTHAHYPRIDQNQLQKQIDNAKTPKDVSRIFFPPILKQCIEVGDFPKNFQ